MAHDTLDSLESIRPRLFGIAYRMLGVVADAEEVVQEALLRWQQTSEALRSDEAWLVSVVTRLAIDRLRRAASERAAYRGGWLPAPVATPLPDRDAELADDLSVGFLLLLERLTPEERAAFLLREVFDSEYAEIARTLEKTETACRQLVHRAKQHVRRRRQRFHVASDVRERLAHRFVEALRAEDREGLLALLTNDALLAADGGGRVPAVAETQQGAARVAQLLVAFERASRTELSRRGSLQPEHDVACLNGEPAVLTMAGGKLLFATILHLEGDRIGAIYRVLNPGKLGGLGFKTFFDPEQQPVGGVS